MDADSTIKLQSNDGKEIEISRKAAQKSGIIKGILEDYVDETLIPLNKVNGAILEKVKDYLVHYQDKEPPKIEVPLKSINFKECVTEWDYNFLGEDVEVIFSLLDASNYMDIKSLFELASAKLGSKIKGMTSDSVKKDFEIGELTKEELVQVLNDKKYLEDNL